MIYLGERVMPCGAVTPPNASFHESLSISQSIPNAGSVLKAHQA